MIREWTAADRRYYRDWRCPYCGEQGAEASTEPRYLDDGQACLSGYSWFVESYPPNTKHHWADGSPLNLRDAWFWYTVRDAEGRVG